MKIKELNEKLQGTVDSLSGLSTDLGTIATQLDKAKTEILNAVQDADLPAETVAKIEALGSVVTALNEKKTAVASVSQAIDDLNPDQPPTP